jgi:hypothetical protein
VLRLVENKKSFIDFYCCNRGSKIMLGFPSKFSLLHGIGKLWMPSDGFFGGIYDISFA